MKKDWYNSVYLPYYYREEGEYDDDDPGEQGSFGSYRRNDLLGHSPQKYETRRDVDKKSRDYDRGYRPEHSDNDSKKHNGKNIGGKVKKIMTEELEGINCTSDLNESLLPGNGLPSWILVYWVG